ncbi:small subunit ribosomal protein S1 [Lachnospiraceae bacterium NK3A20]|nr:small subunit ribosomal protein S1 [Lachnospiraceae bacterium NK3A20]
MSEEQTFEQMLDASLKTIHQGEVVEGTVIDVKPEEAVLNIGYKSDAILTRQEYSNENSLDLTTKLAAGDALQVKVIKVNDGEGQVAVSYKRMAAERANEALREAFENKTVIKAKVSQVVKGGVTVDVDGARVFIPASLLSDRFERDLNVYQDQEIEFVITEFDPAKRRIIGDRKQLMAAQKAKAQEELFATLQIGDVKEGTVRNVTDFGAFVDIGGADGLLHISEMGWGHTENPKKVFKPGQKLRVLVKEINGKKIGLSLKFPDENPWIAASDKYAIGNVVTGKVARLTDFGAFVELEPGIDALLHVSQISRQRVEKPSDVLKVGDEVTAKITAFDAEQNRISLSVRALEADEEKAQQAADEAAEATAFVPGTEDDEAVTVDIDAMIARQKKADESAQ